MGKIKTILGASILLLVSVQVSASPIIKVDSNGQLTGATGVNVDGSFYDVEFVDGTCTEVFTRCEQDSFIFKTNVSANLASEALIQQVFLDVALRRVRLHTIPH